MLFNSFSFLVFFPIVTIAYFILPHRWRWLWLLLASCYFYMAFVPAYILILFFTIIIDYIAGIMIEKSDGKKKKLYFISSILANVGILFFFKYFNFFNNNISGLANFLHWNYTVSNLNILLPIGLSFHTFQAMSYTIEVYRGKQKAERHFGIYALYVMFFPQLVAGPIERPQNLLHQFYESHKFEYQRVVDGIKLMAWGFFKKLVIADRLAILVDKVYSDPTNFSGLSLIVATYLFAFQIYCDFSGYSDIALGSAKVLGFNLIKNFNRPYFSKSITEFWRRWHISLSNWFRDYLYIPLGGSRVSQYRNYLNLFIVFLASGLWHGASWNFVLWGGLHGFFVVLEKATTNFRESISKFFQTSVFKFFFNLFNIFITFNLVSFTWIFFRAKSTSDAFYIVRNIFTDFNINFYSSVGWTITSLATALFFLIFLLVAQIIQSKIVVADYMSKKPTWLRWTFYLVFFWIIIIFGKFGNQEFIYFVF